MSLGIDKINLHTKEFIVRGSHTMTIQPMAYKPNSQEQKEEPLLWKGQRGSKAYLNNELYNLTVSDKGLNLSYNPSKILHPYNLTNDTNQVKELCENVRESLLQNGIVLPPDNELRVSRFDMAKNEQMALPIQFYSPLFKSMRGKRMNNREYPSSYYFANKSRELNFYDKSEEVSNRKESGEPITIPDRLMRGELRAKKSATVGSIYRVNDLHSILEVGDAYREDKYKSTIRNQIFANGNNTEQLQMFAIDYDKEVRVLKALKQRHTRGSIDKYLAYKGIDSLLDEIGNLDNLRQMLLDAGYSPKYTFRVVRQVESQIQALSFFQSGNQGDNISKLYNEVYSKFAV